MTTTLRVPRSRGALSGLLLVLLGLWGALLPLIGPYFDFGFAPDKAWDFTGGRVWLQVVPGCAVFLGGLITLGSAHRAFAAFGAWLAAVGGAWFAIGVPLSASWADRNHIRLGSALGGTGHQVTEQISLLYGLGVVAVFLAAAALGRLAVVGVKDALLAEQVQAERAEREAETGHDTPATIPPAAEETTGSRPPLAQRKAGPGRTRKSARPEDVPATPAEQTARQTVTPSDVRVAGRSGSGAHRERPGANA